MDGSACVSEGEERGGCTCCVCVSASTLHAWASSVKKAREDIVRSGAVFFGAVAIAEGAADGAQVEREGKRPFQRRVCVSPSAQGRQEVEGGVW